MTSRILNGVQVIILTTGHHATDHRIYDKEACGLSALGASVTIIGNHPDKKLPTNNIKIVNIPAPGNRIQRFLQQSWHCWRISSQYKADILHIQDAELLQIIPWIRLKRPHVKIVYDVHEDFANLMKIRSYLPKFLKPLVAMIVNKMEKGLARFVHGIVGVTQPLTDRFSNRHRIAVYNFPSQRFYDYARSVCKPITEREYDLIHLGTLSDQRALFLVDTLQKLHRQRIGTRTLITGVHEHIFNKIRALLPSGCELECQIPYDQVPLRLGNARVGLDVHPFRTANLEVAVPVKIFEYMACGCGVVTSKMPVLNDLLVTDSINSKDIISINGGTPEMYATAIINMLDRINNGDDVGKRLQKAAQQKYVWEREAEKLANFYLKLLKC
ncbi:MAG: glycosyltransferase [Planctomycetia bacterium]|nr:glycosyltransferase [Planctomycetia bacterium]GJQ22983.1 MAG: glycosyl transferase [Candidatus Brocadia sapporoensis]